MIFKFIQFNPDDSVQDKTYQLRAAKAATVAYNWN